MAERRGTSKSATSADSAELLVDAAIKVFALHGFEGTTVKHIADEAGVNISLISYHFGGKEGLYRSCLQTFGTERLEATERILSAPKTKDDFRIRIRLFAADFIDLHLREPDICTIIHRGMERMDETTVEVFRDVFVRIFTAVHGFMNAAKSAGLIKANVEPEIAAGTMFGSLAHTMHAQCFAKLLGKPTLDDPSYRELFIDQWVQTMTQGLEQ